MGGYALGVDLGTTWTAAAVARDGQRPEMVALGGRAAAVPTIVGLQPEGWFAVGDAAARRAATEPDRTGREFKRRVGDTAPILLGGSPYSAESLLATVLWWVVSRVTEQEGGPPERIVVTHPANWGVLRRELLEQAITQAGMTAALATEPEAAAIHYASQERVPDGTVVAVYDLGGGTFDATVLRKTPAGFDVLGRPSGVERLGGVDFDAAVLAHITSQLGSSWSQLDPDDPATRSAVARLRDDCIEAKEALSEDPAAVVPVNLPTISTEVRITRAELEAMIRPSIEASADALARAIADAGLEPAAVDRIILVGGSSRIPLVAQVLTSRFARPLAVDTHPKHAVALGAARLAAGTAALPGPAPAPAAVAPTAPIPPAPAPAPTEPVAAPAPLPAPAAAKPKSKAPLLVGAAVAVVVLVVAALVLTKGGGDEPEAADGNSSGSSGEVLLPHSDDTGTITVSGPGRWNSLGGAPIDTDFFAPDMIVATDKDAFPASAGVAGVEVTLFDADTTGSSGADGLVSPRVDQLELVSACQSDDGGDQASVAGFDGSTRTFRQCGDTSSVVLFGGVDGDGRGLRVELHLVDAADEAAADGVLASIEIGDAPAGGQDQSAAAELEGSWLYAGGATECDGLAQADCDQFESDGGFTLDFTIDCSGSAGDPPCTVQVGTTDPVGFVELGGDDPDVLFAASGILSNADGFHCDGQPDETTFDFNVTEVGRGGDGNPTRLEIDVVLNSADGATDGNSCVAEHVAVTGSAERT